MVIELQAGGSVLRLTCDHRNWCRASLRTPIECDRELGADDKNVLTGRLRGALAGNIGTAIGKIEGVDVSWVTSLSENHSTIYAAEIGADLELFFQDATGNLAARIRLSSLVRAQWMQQLDAIGTNGS
jgi:hypothetical protein